MKILLKNRELSAFLAILALFAVLVALNPSYLSLQTLGMIFASSQILILLAIGAALVMLTRNIDVSVGSTVGLSAIAVGVALNSGYSLPVSILFALSIGALAGAFNGFLVVGLRIPAIVATLGTLGLYRGAMLLWTGGKWIEGLPPGLKSLSEPAAVGISPLGMLVLIIAATGAWTLSRTAFGRDFYAVGDNLTAARQLGVAVNRTRMIAFTLNGLLAACAGIVFAAQIGFVPNQTGSGLEMKAIAACVLGGISLLGGTGTLVGAFLGAFFLTQIDTVLVLFRLPAWWNDFIAGLVLLGVLVLKERLRRLQWVAVAMAAVGVAWLTIDAGTPPWIALGLACSFGLYGLLRKLVSVDPVAGLGVESMYLFLPALAFAIWAENGHGGAFFHGWGWRNDLLLVFGGAVTAVPLIGFAYGVKRIPLSLVGILQYIAPSLQLLLGVFFFHEGFDTAKAIGFAAIWAGLILFVGDNIRTMRAKR